MAEDVVLNMSIVDKLAADFWNKFHTFLTPLRSSTVDWVKAGEQLKKEMDPEQFLAWVWTKRREMLTDQLRRECDRLSISDRKRASQGDTSPEIVDSVLAGLTNGSAQRQDRVARAFRGHLAKHFDVPGKDSMPLGLMKSPDLKAAAAGLGGRAADLMRRKRFLLRLEKGLPPDEAIYEHYTEAQVESMWSTLAAIVR